MKYIVIHYCGAVGTAKNNAAYFKNANRGASAHYFVGYEGEIVQVVKDEDEAWHCNTKGTYTHSLCRNHNAIGIEMCVRNKNGNVNRVDANSGWYFEKKTVETTQRLVAYLMALYKVPLENVIRHYDVTGKWCPAPYVNGQMEWQDFIKGVQVKQYEEEKMTQEQFNELMNGYIAGLNKKAGSDWSVNARKWAIDNKLIVGDGKGNYQWQGLVTREQMAAIMQRFEGQVK